MVEVVEVLRLLSPTDVNALCLPCVCFAFAVCLQAFTATVWQQGLRTVESVFLTSIYAIHYLITRYGVNYLWRFFFIPAVSCVTLVSVLLVPCWYLVRLGEKRRFVGSVRLPIRTFPHTQTFSMLSCSEVNKGGPLPGSVWLQEPHAQLCRGRSLPERYLTVCLL